MSLTSFSLPTFAARATAPHSAPSFPALHHEEAPPTGPRKPRRYRAGLHPHGRAEGHRAVEHPYGARAQHGEPVRPGRRVLRRAHQHGGRGRGGAHRERADRGLLHRLGPQHGRHRGGVPTDRGEGQGRCRHLGDAGPVGGTGRQPGAGHPPVRVRGRHPACHGRQRCRARCRDRLRPHPLRRQRGDHGAVRHQRGVPWCGRCGHGHAFPGGGQRDQHRAGPPAHLRHRSVPRTGAHGCGGGHHHRSRAGRGLPAAALVRQGKRHAVAAPAPALRGGHRPQHREGEHRRHRTVPDRLGQLVVHGAHREHLRRSGRGGLHLRHARHRVQPAAQLGHGERGRHVGGPEPGRQRTRPRGTQRLALRALQHGLHGGRGHPVLGLRTLDHGPVHHRSRGGGLWRGCPAHHLPRLLLLRLRHGARPGLQRRR